MAEFEIAVTRRGARMLMRVDARDAAEARTLVAKAMGDGVVFEAAPVRGSAGATASALRPTGLPFLLQASAAGMAAFTGWMRRTRRSGPRNKSGVTGREGIPSRPHFR